MGHRSLMRYYKQRFGLSRAVAVARNQKAVGRVLQQYRALGWTGSTGRSRLTAQPAQEPTLHAGPRVEVDAVRFVLLDRLGGASHFLAPGAPVTTCGITEISAEFRDLKPSCSWCSNLLKTAHIAVTFS